jgi:hypothetical protein
MIEKAHRMELGLTLLTPVMTDKEIQHTAPLFRHLSAHCPDTEVVCNDWGLMLFLRARYPALALSAGRILNKGFKDPRLMEAQFSGEETSEHLKTLLNWSTFEGGWIQDQLGEMGIGRCEQDLLPYQDKPITGNGRFAASVYLPFGYVTFGRICWAASFDQTASERFMPPRHCGKPCRHIRFELKDKSFRFRLFQLGNTIFYLYPARQLENLLQTAQAGELRLVYQGFWTDAS